MLWGVLSKLLEDQIITLRSLLGSYESQNSTVLHDEDKDNPDDKITAFRDEKESQRWKVQNLLEKLTAPSQNLIQLVQTPVPKYLENTSGYGDRTSI